jgi:outer membrane lipoprotein SlyB
MRKEKAMKKSSSIKAALVPCILAVAFISLLCFPATAQAQADLGTQPAKPAAKAPAYTPPPDLMIYFRTGPRENSIGVQVANFNVPGLPHNLNYLRQTVEALEEIGYEVPESPARAAVQVRVTAKYNQVDNSQAVAKEAGGRAVAGAVLGVLGGLAAGGGGQGAAQGAAGGAAAGVASGSATPGLVKYLTLEFDISSSKGGTQTGQVTKDITNIDMRPEEFIDATIADYLEVSFPKKR